MYTMELYNTLIFGVLISLVTASDVQSKPSCEEFSKDVTFQDAEALGIWHLLYFRTQSGPEQIHCIEITDVSEEECKELAADHDDVKGLKWERLTLKMDIPCSLVQSNRTRTYYLEKIMGNGSYRTLQVKPGKENPTANDYHLYPMRLKILDGGYLGMMDCNEKFVFIMGREPAKPKNQETDENLKKHIKTYWPEDF